MINLYVGSISRILSSSLILSALVFILYTLGQKEVQWSRTFAVLFVLGLLMPIMSGTRMALVQSEVFLRKGNYLLCYVVWGF